MNHTSKTDPGLDIDDAKMPPAKIGGDWLEAPYRMKSGRNDPDRKYKMVIGKSGTVWIYEKNVAQPLYCSGGRGSHGFGGSELTFQLEDSICGSITLKGPWSSNTDAFFTDTGIDYRNLFWSHVVIAKYRLSAYNEKGITTGQNLFKEVLYFENEPMQGPYNRYEEIVKLFADRYDHPIYYHYSTMGGGGSGPAFPSSWTREQQQEYWKNPDTDFKRIQAAHKAKQKEVREVWLKANPPPPAELFEDRGDENDYIPY